MMNASAPTDRTSKDTGIRALRDAARPPVHEAPQEVPADCPRIALLTPYNGGNLGDAAIQDAVIGNLRLRLPGAQFSGISLNGDNFVERHGTRSFPLCGSDGPFYRMYRGNVTDQPGDGESLARTCSAKSWNSTLIKRALKRVPALWPCLKMIHALGRRVYREVRHCAGGYRFLRMQDLLIVSGGGQLDEEWGGPWGHPFTLFKWAVLARTARVPYAIASVGACNIASTTSRLFLSAALRMAQYRSYRDNHSRDIASRLLQRPVGESVVPDLAFSLPPSDLLPPAGIRSIAPGRTIVAISPIAYAKPGSWPCPNRALHDRYLQQMTDVVAQLLVRGYFLVIVCSSLGDDERVILELLERLDEQFREIVARQIHIPRIRTWKDLIASLRDVDLLIASRLHSAILGFLTQTPTVAISFDPKVDWVMEDVGQTDYLMHIRDFTSEDVIEAVDRIELHKSFVSGQIRSYQRAILSASTRQYDALIELAMASHRRPN
jgi:polysaccharide pyruvyl transferase WcaK-like protein